MSETRAGIVPFIRLNEEEIQVYLMIPSDPDYGGIEPQIAKGMVDPGEELEFTAIREGEEELGLKKTNLIGSPVLGWSGEVKGMSDMYTMSVYVVEVKDPDDFNKPHYETGWAGWLPVNQALLKIRSSQRNILKSVLSKI